ncbi:Lrp/AsnC ligand binding domain-containing protein [Novosphingobium profundi]
MRKHPKIIECFSMSGDSDYMLPIPASPSNA